LTLSHDIVLDDNAFYTASRDMAILKSDTDNLKTKLEEMYAELAEALETPAGEVAAAIHKDILIKPIEDMILIISHISTTLEEIAGTGYYKDVFIKFEELNQTI